MESIRTELMRLADFVELDAAEGPLEFIHGEIIHLMPARNIIYLVNLDK